MRAGRPLVVLLLLASAGLPACGAAPRGGEVDGARALARVQRQVDAGPRIPGRPGHAAVQEWIAAELTRLGGTVERQRFTDRTLAEPLPLVNVIGHFGPRATAGERLIVLAAHYDTRPWCDEDPDSSRRHEPLPGANDAGSGVAVLLEVAELLSRRPPKVAVDLVFFDGEDQGRPGHPEEYSLGARGYAARLSAPRPTAVFLFDMVGDRDLDIHPEQRSAEQAANLVAMVLAGARATSATAFKGMPRHRITDDHVPLLEAGVPAVDIIDFDYAAWHTVSDLPDQVSAQSLAEVARVAAWLVYSSPLARRR
jgi:acetylornithine deacetylase/succinyl-diaminopimelate desuccinylase-like protein